MQVKTQEHQDVMCQFEMEFRGHRLDREAKDCWPRARIYQDGRTNELFLAYRRGYALARSVYIASFGASEATPRSAHRETK